MIRTQFLRIACFGLACVLAASVLVPTVGCTTRRPGVTVTDGYLKRYTEFSVDEVARGVESAYRDFGVIPTKQFARSFSHGDGFEFTAINHQNTRFLVRIKPSSTGATEVGVKVTPGENEGAALQLMERVIAYAG
ncbi:MAG: hypothetical protein AAGF84_00230 [Planctomycetota bacterium]